MTTPAQVWERFATQAKPRRSANAAGATTWLNWTQYPDHGPDESVLGPVQGKRVVELGSGAGANLAHLATLGAQCTGVDVAPSRTAVAGRTWGMLPNVEFVTADAAGHLAAQPQYYDIVYSIFGAVWFTDPAMLLPRIRDALAPGGVLAFSHLPPGDTAESADRLITRYHLSLEWWRRLLDDLEFVNVTGEIIPAPVPGKLGTMLVRARRR